MTDASAVWRPREKPMIEAVVPASAPFSRDARGNNWVVVAILNSNRPWGASSILDQVLLDLYASTRGQ